MKIGVISDTHIPRAAAKIPREVLKAFKGADMILHAGDLVDSSVLKELRKIAETKAVCGNMDKVDLAGKLPEREIIKAGRFRIGLIHGYGSPSALPHTVMSEFGGGIDAIVFGHSHIPMNEKKGGVLLFNPGSPTDKMYAPYNSYGILEVTKDGITGKIVRIS